MGIDSTSLIKTLYKGGFMRKIIFVYLFMLFGCALSAIQPEINHIKPANQNIDEMLGTGTVLLFNNAGIGH